MIAQNFKIQCSERPSLTRKVQKVYVKRFLDTFFLVAYLAVLLWDRRKIDKVKMRISNIAHSSEVQSLYT